MRWSLAKEKLVNLRITLTRRKQSFRTSEKKQVGQKVDPKSYSSVSCIQENV